jgi:oligopeptide transport system permease protein
VSRVSAPQRGASGAGPGRADGAPGLGPWRTAWRRARSNRAASVGALLLAAIAFACFGLPALLALDPQSTAPALRHQPPSAAHWLGTDALGRDLLARVLIGGRTSLSIGLAATLASVVIGVVWGGVAGYFGDPLDEALMRIVDFLYAIPYMFLVILAMLLFADTARGEALPVFVALGLVQWLTMARIVRGQVLALRRREFVLAARALGASHARILFRHVLPNCGSSIVVYATLGVPVVIILESYLSFLGLGVELSWGQLVAEGVAVVNPIRSPWWLLVFPSAFLAATLLALNFLGDGLRDSLDPRGAAR